MSLQLRSPYTQLAAVGQMHSPEAEEGYTTGLGPEAQIVILDLGSNSVAGAALFAGYG
jgi:hypothetical protein